MISPTIRNSCISENAKQAIASVNLSFSDDMTPFQERDMINMLMRIESGETTYDQEEARLLHEWNKIKNRKKLGNIQ